MSAPDGALYPPSFQPQQTPALAALAAAAAGHAFPLGPRLAVLDAGCGRGHVVHVLAAANPGWVVIGLDRDAAALAEAREVAEEAGLANARFVEADLAEAGAGWAEATLPPLDVALAHGVWSWAGAAGRRGLAAVLARRLRPGGLLYLGHNAAPEASRDGALRHLLRHLAGGLAGAAGAERAVGGLRAAFGAEPGRAPPLPAPPQPAPPLPAPPLPAPFLPDTPMLRRLLADPPALHPGFVAQEFLADSWDAAFPDEVADALAPAKLDFLGSANLREALGGGLALGGPGGGAAGLARLFPGGGPAREMAKDLALARPFRADVFARGRRRGDPVALLDAIVLLATAPPPEEPPALGLGAGVAAVPTAMWEAALRPALAAGGAVAVGALRRRAAAAGFDPHPLEIAAALVDTGLALPVFAAPEVAPAAARLHRATAARHARAGRGPGWFGLVSAAARGGLPADSRDLALVAALGEAGGAATPEAVADRAGLDPGEAAERLAARRGVWQAFAVC